MKRFFKYVYYFLSAETKHLRAEAYKAAQAHYSQKPLRDANNPHPRVAEYRYRTLEFQNFQRGYINQRCHEIATAKLNQR